jgi:hypothetical protein
MATNVIPASFGQAKPTRVELEAIRAALILCIDAAAERAKWGRNPESEGMPSRLFAAGCYLAHHGFNDFPCAGEHWFATSFISYKAPACAEMIEDGRRAIYDGGRRAILQRQPVQVAA